MRKRVAVVGAAVGLLALLVGGVSPALGSSSGGAASASSDETNEGQTIRVVAVFKETAEIDNGAQGFSLGDDVVFSGNLRRDGARVGHIGVVCTFTSAANRKHIAAQCPATVDLPGGQITTQALVFNLDLKVLSITGGSDEYQGAEGEVNVSFRSQTRAVLTFHLQD
jgi:hypothetical protein